MDDLAAVMEAAGSREAALVGWSEGGPMSLLFAATFPERTRSLTVFGSGAAFRAGPDNPGGVTPATRDAVEHLIAGSWGTGRSLDLLVDPPPQDPGLRRWWGRFERQSASPGAAAALLRMAMDTDVRDVLAAIRAPTLVMHRVGDPFVPVELSRRLAEQIPGARLVELPGREHPIWLGDQDAVLAEISELVTGSRSGPDPDRVVATVLFIDITGSTRLAAELGDRAWRERLDRFRTLVRRELVRHRGREVVTTGDGFLATFDGPARAVRCALAIRAAVGELGLSVHAGLHAGEIELTGDDVAGISVHTAARVMGEADDDEVLVSSTVRDLVAGSGLEFAERGRRSLKGVPGEWELLAVVEDGRRTARRG
jgi:class 3 adenylate cyclase